MYKESVFIINQLIKFRVFIFTYRAVTENVELAENKIRQIFV